MTRPGDAAPAGVQTAAVALLGEAAELCDDDTRLQRIVPYLLVRARCVSRLSASLSSLLACLPACVCLLCYVTAALASGQGLAPRCLRWRLWPPAALQRPQRRISVLSERCMLSECRPRLLRQACAPAWRSGVLHARTGCVMYVRWPENAPMHQSHWMLACRRPCWRSRARRRCAALRCAAWATRCAACATCRPATPKCSQSAPCRPWTLHGAAASATLDAAVQPESAA